MAVVNSLILYLLYSPHSKGRRQTVLQTGSRLWGGGTQKRHKIIKAKPPPILVLLSRATHIAPLAPDIEIYMCFMLRLSDVYIVKNTADSVVCVTSLLLTPVPG